MLTAQIDRSEKSLWTVWIFAPFYPLTWVMWAFFDDFFQLSAVCPAAAQDKIRILSRTAHGSG